MDLQDLAERLYKMKIFLRIIEEIDIIDEFSKGSSTVFLEIFKEITKNDEFIDIFNFNEFFKENANLIYSEPLNKEKLYILLSDFSFKLKK